MPTPKPPSASSPTLISSSISAARTLARNGTFRPSLSSRKWVGPQAGTTRALATYGTASEATESSTEITTHHCSPPLYVGLDVPGHAEGGEQAEQCRAVAHVVGDRPADERVHLRHRRLRRVVALGRVALRWLGWVALRLVRRWRLVRRRGGTPAAVAEGVGRPAAAGAVLQRARAGRSCRRNPLGRRAGLRSDRRSEASRDRLSWIGAGGVSPGNLYPGVGRPTTRPTAS